MRNYYAQPLKRGEKIPYDDLYEIYINQNYNRINTAKYFNTTETVIRKNYEYWGIKKSPELIKACQQAKWEAKTTHLSYEELYEFYIIQNLSLDELGEKYNLTKDRLLRELKRYNITKSRALQVQVSKRTCLEKYGEDNPSKVKNIAEKIKNTFNENRVWKRETQRTELGLWRDYTKYPLKTRELIPEEDLYVLYILYNMSAEEIGQLLNISKNRVRTCAKKFGFKKTSEQQQENKERTFERKYGNRYYLQTQEGKQKTKETLIERFGTDIIAHIPEAIEKRKQTNLRVYGYENPNQSPKVKEKSKKTLKNQTGYEYAFQVPSIKEKIKNTVQEKYNVENISQCSIIKDKKQKTFEKHYDTPEKRAEIIVKSRRTNKERYGDECFMRSEFCNKDEMQRKHYETMKRNNSFIRSNPEHVIKELLLKKFKEVKTETKTKLYPHRCDFYIPELDLYIEYQEHPSHCTHAFNIKSNEDLLLFNLWLKRSQEINFKGEKKKSYKGYLKVWFIKDRQKRLDAKKNNLNWLEFFNMKDFMAWYETI